MAGSLENFYRRVRGGLRQATFAQKRQLIELLIDRVIVTDEQVELRSVIPTSPRGEQIRFSHLHTDYFFEITIVILTGLGEILACFRLSSLPQPVGAGVLE